MNGENDDDHLHLQLRTRMLGIGMDDLELVAFAHVAVAAEGCENNTPSSLLAAMLAEAAKVGAAAVAADHELVVATVVVAVDVASMNLQFDGSSIRCMSVDPASS